MQDDLLHQQPAGQVARRLMRKGEYARHRACSASLISKVIRTGRLTAPALTAEGLIDVDLADRQLAERAQVVRIRRQNPGEEASGGLAGGESSPTDLALLAASKRRAAQLDVELKQFHYDRTRGEYIRREVAEQALQAFVQAAVAALDHTRPDRAQRLVGLATLEQSLAAVERQDAAYRTAVAGAAQRCGEEMTRLA